MLYFQIAYNDLSMANNDTLLHHQLDEYRIESLLGSGGMARVYLGTDIRLKRRVAIKVIEKPHRSKPDYLRRFEMEAQAIARLDHPHIVRLYRLGETNSLVYMAMQYVEGVDLETILRSYRTDDAFIELDEAARIIREICLALDYAHAKGIIHRDVKPSNVMLDRSGEAILTDFGLVLLEEVTTQGKVLGTPHYASPEQVLSSANVVPQSDLYSVGVILYEMLTGQVPFDSQEALEVARMQVEVPVPSLRSIRPAVNLELESVVLKAMAKNPEKRFQSGDALANAFEKAIVSTQIESQPRPTRSHLTIPERVSLQVDETPQLLEKEYETPPFTRSRYFWLGAGALTILVVVICLMLSLGGLWASGTLGLSPMDSITPKNISQTPQVASASRKTPSSSPAASVTIEQSPTLSPSFSPTATPTISPSPTSSATPTPSASFTTSASPTATSSPTSTPSPISIPEDTKLHLINNKEDSLVLINKSDGPFYLLPLRLGKGDAAIEGQDWEVSFLEPDECVVAVKTTGNPELPDVECRQVGKRLRYQPSSIFWDKDFDVFYNEEKWGKCKQDKKEIDCEIEH